MSRKRFFLASKQIATFLQKRNSRASIFHTPCSPSSVWIRRTGHCALWPCLLKLRSLFPAFKSGETAVSKTRVRYNIRLTKFCSRGFFFCDGRKERRTCSTRSVSGTSVHWNNHELKSYFRFTVRFKPLQFVLAIYLFIQISTLHFPFVFRSRTFCVAHTSHRIDSTLRDCLSMLDSWRNCKRVPRTPTFSVIYENRS